MLGVSNRVVGSVFLLAAALCTPLAGAVSDVNPAQQTFNSIYAQQIRELKTPVARAAFARRLLADATAAPADKPLQALTLLKAAELSKADPSGYSTGIAAMQKLAADQPDRADEAEQHELEILDLQSHRGTAADRTAAAASLGERWVTVAARRESNQDLDGAEAAYVRALGIRGGLSTDDRSSIETRLRIVQGVRAATRRLALLSKVLTAHPDDAKAGPEYVQLAVFELDKPELATPYLASADAELTQEVPLAVKKIPDLSEADLLHLAHWYKSHAAKGDEAAKAVAALREHRYFAAYLKKHTAHDAEWLEAKNAVAEPLAPSAFNDHPISLKVLEVATKVYQGQSANYAHYKDYDFDVGIGAYPDGWGAGAVAALHIARVQSVTFAVEPPAKKYENKNADSFAGFFIDYHTPAGFSKRVAIAAGMGNAKRGGDPVVGAGDRRPDQFVDLGSQRKYQLTLADWAPPDWDGEVWLIVAIENTGMDTSFRSKIIAAEAE